MGRRGCLSTPCLLVFLFLPCLAVCHAGVVCPTPITITSVTPSPWFAGGTYNITIAGAGISCGATFVTVQVNEGAATLSNLTFVSANEITATVSISADAPTETACVSVLVGNDGPIQPAAAPDAQTSCIPQGDYSAVKTVQIIGGCEAALQVARKGGAAISRADQNWAVLEEAGEAHNIDPNLLAAIAVRETGFLNVQETDGAGVGVGVFQITVSPTSGVTADEASNLPWAADYAAGLLASNMAYLSQRFPDFTPAQLLRATAASYNMNPYKRGNFTGDPNPIDKGTARGNYGSNVVALMSCFER
ncbi:MAG TPA: IPT/TIG domain-containing protein [Acidobacteriaceae bacterium]|nr:IPT/TIG domain-containing protein [Acidobacteriaceae bacterium]